MECRRGMGGWNAPLCRCDGCSADRRVFIAQGEDSDDKDIIAERDSLSMSGPALTFRHNNYGDAV